MKLLAKATARLEQTSEKEFPGASSDWLMPAVTNRAVRIILEPTSQPWNKIQCIDMSIKLEPVLAFQLQSNCCLAERPWRNKMQIPIKSIEQAIRIFTWCVPTRPLHVMPKRMEQTPLVFKSRPPSHNDESGRPRVNKLAKASACAAS